MRRRAALAAVVLAGAAACSGAAPTPAGPPTTREDFTRALLTWDTLPRGYFVTTDDTFVRTTGPAARQGLLDGFEVPVGPSAPAEPPRCDTTTGFDQPDPVALVVALDRTTQLVLVQGAGPAGVDLAALGRAVAACPTSAYGPLTVDSAVLPAPDVAADATLALRFDIARRGQGDQRSRRATQVMAWADVGPVVVGVYVVARGRDVDPAVVADALRAAVARARGVTG
ncbi:hypothetical protein GCM10027047_05060 [Rhodococcus aerolatus]